MLSVSIHTAPPAAIGKLDAIVLVVANSSDSTTVAKVMAEVNAIDGYDLSRQSISKRVQRLNTAGLLVRDELNARSVNYAISELGEQTLAELLEFYEKMATLA